MAPPHGKRDRSPRKAAVIEEEKVGTPFIITGDGSRLRTVRERAISEEVSKTASLIMADH